MAEIIPITLARSSGALPPDAIRKLPLWLCWRLVQKPGNPKPSKMPYYADGAIRSGDQGSADDRARLVTFDAALKACSRMGMSGVGLATVPGARVVALDFDDCLVDGVITSPLIAALPQVTYTEYSPSGRGIRAFMLGDLPSRKDTKPAAGRFPVEFFGDTGFVTVTCAVHPDCELWGTSTEVCDLTPEVLAMYRERFGDPIPERNGVGNGVVDDNDAWLMGLVPTMGWSQDQTRLYLFDCDPSCSRQEWLHALMAVHHESGGAQWALDLADEWSQGSPKYAGRKDVEGRWASFSKRTGGVGGVGGAGGSSGGKLTGEWLLRHREGCLTRKKYERVGELKKRIEGAASEYDLREKICLELSRDSSVGLIEREQLAHALRDAFRRLGGVLPISMCRKLIEPAGGRAQRSAGADVGAVAVVSGGDLQNVEGMVGEGGAGGSGVVAHERPSWLANWCYVKGMDKFYRFGAHEWVTPSGFDRAFERMVPMDENGTPFTTASRYAVATVGIEVVHAARYMPWCDTFFSVERTEYVNSYNPATVPLANAVVSVEGARAMGIVKRHILDVICSGREDVYRQIMSYIAYCVQNPGRKIRWSPIIKGIEGDGKSFIKSLIAVMMGAPNIGSVSPQVLRGQFTRWAEGTCVTFFEEVRLEGLSRYDALNSVKEYITNDLVMIHPKGVDPYLVVNTTNYIAFTNHADALPLHDTDRRWMVIFSAFNDKQELADYCAQYGGNEQYFADLHATLDNAPCLRRAFLDYEISSEFKVHGPAPMTDERDAMMASSTSDEEIILDEILQSGIQGVGKHYLTTSDLSAAWQLTDTDTPPPQTSRLAKMLERRGWAKYPTRVWMNGRTTYLYSRSIKKINLDVARLEMYKKEAK